ncbi:MAG TPA: ABC transporter permease, partial [Caulobacteraceae bacterium]
MSRVLAPAALIAVILGVWEIATRLLNVPSYILPAPSAIAEALANNAPLLALSAWRTLEMALLALLVAALFAGA